MPDRYRKLMLQYYSVLNNSWKQEIKEAATQAIKALTEVKEGGLLEFVDDLMEVTTQNLSVDMKAALTKPTRIFTEKIYKYSTADTALQVPANTGVGIYGLPQKSAAAKFANQQLFWIGKHFGGDVSERFKNKLTDALNSGLSKQDFANVLKGEFKDLGRSNSYWVGLAENAEIRTRELASSDAYERLGITELEIIAVIDDRTTDICRELNGRLIPVSAMAETRNRLLSVQTEGMDTEAVKSQINAIVPFWSSKDAGSLAGKSTSQIIAANPGLSLPPYHWRCRTRTAPHFGDSPVSIVPGASPLAAKDKTFKNLRNAEIANKYKSVKALKSYSYSSKNFTETGKNEFGITNREYKKKAQDIVNNADRVLSRTYKGQLQFEFYSRKEGGYSVVDSNGVMQGCYGHAAGDLDKCFTRRSRRAHEIKE